MLLTFRIINNTVEVLADDGSLVTEYPIINGTFAVDLAALNKTLGLTST